MRNSATGPGALTDDGCAVEVYRRLRPAGEPEIIHAEIPAGATIRNLSIGLRPVLAKTLCAVTLRFHRMVG